MSVDVVEVSSNDPDLARATLSRLYAPGSNLQTLVSSRRIEFSVRAVQAGELHAGRFRHTLATRAAVAPFEDFVAATVLSGELHLAAGREQRILRRGAVVHYPTTSALSGAWSGLDIVMLRIPMTTVEQAAGALTGVAPADLRFAVLAPVSTRMTAQWHALAGFVHGSLNAPSSVLENPLVRRQLVDLVAATALTVFPNTTMSSDRLPGPGRVAPAAVRRAVAYIHAHAAEPVGITDIAQAAGITPRALQAAFLRCYGLTPSGFLRRVRLEGAHRDLRAADPTNGDTVGAIAARWGFGHAARFTTFYRQQFGVLPSHTLRL